MRRRTGKRIATQHLSLYITYYLKTIFFDSGSSSIASLLPHSSMALWPGIKELLGFDKNEKVFSDLQNFVLPFMKKHKTELDPDNIKDFMDLMLVEIQNTTDPKSSFYGETGHFALFNNIIDLFIAGMETTSSALLWTFLYMLHHPDIQSKVHDEIDQVSKFCHN